MGNCFYVSNLEQSDDLSELKWLFTTIGDVESIRMELFQESTRGFATVEMKTEKQAQDCIERFEGKTVAGGISSVLRNKPRDRRREAKI